MRISRAMQWLSRLRFPITLRALPARLNLGVDRATEWLWGDYPPRLRSPKEEFPMKALRPMLFIEVSIAIVTLGSLVSYIAYRSP